MVLCESISALTVNRIAFSDFERMATNKCKRIALIDFYACAIANFRAAVLMMRAKGADCAEWIGNGEGTSRSCKCWSCDKIEFRGISFAHPATAHPR